MEYTKQAIELAIKGGYDPRHYGQFIHISFCRIAVGEHYLLDPLFYQSLGKSLGWGENAWGSKNVCDKCGDEKCGRGFYCGRANNSLAYEKWQFEWHSLIDHLASGQDIESFFKELLTK